MKYRSLVVDIDKNYFTTIIIQVKRWFGWTTIKTIEKPYIEAIDESDALLKLLRT